jgi:hypothetical protein
LGVAIFALGLGCAAWIWIGQDRVDRKNAGQPADDSGELATLDSRKAIRGIEMNYGQSAVLVEEFMEWLASLAHGKRLAWTVAVLSSILGAGCFLASAYVLPVLDAPAEPERPGLGP